ncbi:MAG: HAD family hydrolase [Actinomycetes bacterium]
MTALPVEAVIFDVDGTLIDYEYAQREGLRRHLSDSGSSLVEAVWDRWQVAEERHFARYLAGELTFEGQRRERVREFVGGPFTDDDADAWFDGYRSHFESSWRLFDDVLDTLDGLSDRPLAAFSNVSGHYTRRKIAAVGLEDRFVVTWGIDDVGAAKPDPRPFHRVCSALGVETARTLHVGDRYEADALGACEAGLVGVWLHRPGAQLSSPPQEHPIDRRVTTVSSLSEVVGFVSE